MKNQHMFHTLIQLRGNERVCVYTEPLWSIPYFLFIPYASIYMLALGVTEIQIGLIVTIGMISQVIFSILGGVITDKLGRKKTTFIFDVISWGIPTFIWAISQNFTYFAIAAAINGVFRVTANSWNCLLVEDADENKLVAIYSWIHITGLGAAFFSPLTGLFIKRFDVIPTIRVVYFMAFVLMMIKFIILNVVAKETQRGEVRMKETADVSFFQLLKGYKAIVAHILSTKKTLFTMGIMIVIGIVNTVNGSFWSVLATKRLGIAPENIGWFPVIKSLVMLFFFLVILPKVQLTKFSKPLLVGFVIMLVSQILLIISPPNLYIFIALSMVFEAMSLSLINPILDGLQVIMVNKEERARIMAVVYTGVILITSPFGSIAGWLASIDLRLPFLMNVILIIVGFLLVHQANRYAKKNVTI